MSRRTRDPVVFRGPLPFPEALLREVEHLTWEVVGHTPTCGIIARWDQTDRFVHARGAGFDGNRADWRECQEWEDPSAYTAELSGLTRTPPPCCRAHGRRMFVDVFFTADVAPAEFWLSTFSHELAHAADLSVLKDLAPRSLPNIPKRYGKRRSAAEERFADAVAAEVIRRLRYAHPASGLWEKE